MSSGGKGGGSVVTGYKYFMGVQIVPCHGPVDVVRRIIIGEREAWTGAVGSSQTINIDKPELFGGEKREGGVVGDVDIIMGASNEPRNAYLAQHQGPTCPAYRGLLSILFKSFMWSSGNPYFKAPWVELTRILKGWDGDAPWYPAKAYVNDYDMNPAHIVYQCLTSQEWGMGYGASDIDDASFRLAADKLHGEGFGLSIPWDTQSSVEEFVKVILNHVNGLLGLNIRTGRFEIRLIRDDYLVSDLLELNESNVEAIKSFQRAAYGDLANEVVVTYTNRDGDDATIAVQNLASIAAQGGVVSTSKSYPGIRDADLAARVAQRDLATLSTPLAQVTLVCNRVMWEKEIGDVVKLNWPDLGLNGVPLRVVDISKGTLTDAKIEVSLVEDVFGLPSSSYTTTIPTQWTDNVVPPVVADTTAAVEAPYWEVARRVSLADQNYLQPTYGFGMFLAGRGATQPPISYLLSASADGLSFKDVGTGHFNPTGVLASNISPVDTTIILSGAYDLDQAVLSADGGYGYIGSECVSVISVSPENGQVAVGRGVLDTPPMSHPAGTRVFLVIGENGYDETERVSGELVYYRPRPMTGIGTLELEAADTETLTLFNRASRPYAPGNLRIDGQAYPASVPGPNFTVSWSHRDRLAQTVDLVDHTVGNIGPEPGVSYRLLVYSGSSLLRSYDIAGNVTSWSYPTNHDIADGNVATLTIKVFSVRGGLLSAYAAQHTFTRLIAIGGTFVDAPPSKPTLTASAGTFAIVLNWLFGDTRTNIDKTEIWASETPQFDDGATVQYVDYPAVTWTHEIETIGGFRWYWIRVTDTAGQLSEWSAVATSRAGYSQGVPIVDVLPAAPSGGNEVVKLSTDNRLYTWNGTAWVAGAFVMDKIAANSITTEMLQTKAVTADKINGNNLSVTNGTFSGELVAATGTFKGSLSAATGTFAGSLNAATGNFKGQINVGSFTDYNWPPINQYGAHLSASGLLLGNANNNRYFQVTNTGDIYTPGFNVVAGVMTVNAANVIKTLNIAGEAVTMPRSASGVGSVTAPAISLTAGETICVIGTCFGSSGDSAYLTINGAVKQVRNFFSDAYQPAVFVYTMVAPATGTYSCSIQTNVGEASGIIVLGVRR